MVFVITGFRLFGDSRVQKKKKNDGNNVGYGYSFGIFSHRSCSFELRCGSSENLKPLNTLLKRESRKIFVLLRGKK